MSFIHPSQRDVLQKKQGDMEGGGAKMLLNDRAPYNSERKEVKMKMKK